MPRNDLADHLADKWALVAFSCLVIGLVAGWMIHAIWLRARVLVAPTGDGRWAILLGRAVAGVYRRSERTLAETRAAHLRRQIDGHR